MTRAVGVRSVALGAVFGIAPALGLVALAATGCRSTHGDEPKGAATAAVAPPAEACVSASQREKGKISSFHATGTGAELCLDAGDGPASCLALSFGGSAFSLAKPAAASDPASRRVRADAKTVTVCARDGAGGCTTVTADGYDGADKTVVDAPLAAHMPSDASPDGSKVFLVRHEGGEALQIYGETYDVASSKRLSRFELPFDGRVEQVHWLADTIFVVGCVTAGPGCTGKIVHPIRGPIADVDGNFYGIDGAVQPVSEGRWVFVSSGGESVVVRDDDGDLVKAAEIDKGADVELGAAARVIPGGSELVIAYGGPVGGDVVRIDLRSMRVEARATPKTCAGR